MFALLALSVVERFVLQFWYNLYDQGFYQHYSQEDHVFIDRVPRISGSGGATV